MSSLCRCCDDDCPDYTYAECPRCGEDYYPYRGDGSCPCGYGPDACQYDACTTGEDATGEGIYPWLCRACSDEARYDDACNAAYDNYREGY